MTLFNVTSIARMHFIVVNLKFRSIDFRNRDGYITHFTVFIIDARVIFYEQMYLKLPIKLRLVLVF